MKIEKNRESIVTFVLIYQGDFSVMLKVDSEVKFTIRNIMQDHLQYLFFVCLHDCFGFVCFGEGGLACTLFFNCNIICRAISVVLCMPEMLSLLNFVNI